MIPCGYSCLLLLFLLYGLMVGTWSFQMGGEAPSFAARLLRMLHISEASGMVEMSAFCCIASGTADISFVQTLGGRTTAGRLRDIRLSRQHPPPDLNTGPGIKNDSGPLPFTLWTDFGYK